MAKCRGVPFITPAHPQLHAQSRGLFDLTLQDEHSDHHRLPNWSRDLKNDSHVLWSNPESKGPDLSIYPCSLVLVSPEKKASHAVLQDLQLHSRVLVFGNFCTDLLHVYLATTCKLRHDRLSYICCLHKGSHGLTVLTSSSFFPELNWLNFPNFSLTVTYCLHLLA